MSSCKNEVGNRYGLLAVLSRSENKYGNGLNNHRSKAAWLCRCDCGKEFITTGESLRSGRTKSCGCTRSESTKRRWNRTDEQKKATALARRQRELVARKQAKYNLTPEQQTSLYEAQGGICALPSCTRPAGAFDHCHTTGKFRGLLCVKCNTMLGFAYDNPTRLREAADYLEEHRNV